MEKPFDILSMKADVKNYLNEKNMWDTCSWRKRIKNYKSLIWPTFPNSHMSLGAWHFSLRKLGHKHTVCGKPWMIIPVSEWMVCIEVTWTTRIGLYTQQVHQQYGVYLMSSYCVLCDFDATVSLLQYTFKTVIKANIKSCWKTTPAYQACNQFIYIICL